MISGDLRPAVKESELLSITQTFISHVKKSLIKVGHPWHLGSARAWA